MPGVRPGRQAGLLHQVHPFVGDDGRPKAAGDRGRIVLRGQVDDQDLVAKSDRRQAALQQAGFIGGDHDGGVRQAGPGGVHLTEKVLQEGPAGQHGLPDQVALFFSEAIPVLAINLAGVDCLGVVGGLGAGMG